MKLVELTPELLAFAIAGERDAMTRLVAQRGGFLRVAFTPGWRGHALLEGGVVMVAAGIVLHWAGRAEAWLFAHREARRRHLVTATRAAARLLARWQRHPDYRRIEMHVRMDAPWRRTFCRHLGMRLEGVLEAWDPLGRDYGVYARIARPAQEGAA